LTVLLQWAASARLKSEGKLAYLHMRFLITKIFLFPLVFVLSGCGSLFFYPQKPLYDNPRAREFSPRDVFFKTGDGVALHGWFFPAKPEAKGSILVLHGNAQNLGTHINSFLWLIPQGFNVFIFDYRGYGYSQGTPDITGVHLDAEAALEKLFALQTIPGEKVIVFGQSIGGAIAIYTAAHTPYKDRIAAVVADSAFSSYRLIAREKMSMLWLTWPFQYPFSFFFNDDYSPVKWIGQISPVPLLIIHGQQDPVVPLHHGQILYNAASDPKEFRITMSEGHISSLLDDFFREKLSLYLRERVSEFKKDNDGNGRLSPMPQQ
jgi:hypothetical protein